MRKIKFKAVKDTVNKWAFGSLRVWPDGDCDILQSVKDKLYMIPARVIPSTVCEFTGIHDCDGKEIYEHDLVEYTGFVYEVLYNDEKCAFVLKEHTTGKVTDILIGDVFCVRPARVVGNVFDKEDI